LTNDLDLKVEEVSHFGFSSRANSDLRKKLWDLSELVPTRLTPSTFPAALNGGGVKFVWESPEYCVDGGRLMHVLGDPLTDHIGALDEGADEPGERRIHFDTSGNRVRSVTARLRSGESVRFLTRAVVLCAGMDNQALLTLATGGNPEYLTSVEKQQQLRKAHMLVIRGDDRILPPLTGVFPDIGGLFLVSRRLKGETIWLVSDDRSIPMGSPEDMLRFNVKWWLRRVWTSLCRLSPGCFRNPERLQWGIYEAPKAEGRSTGSIPEEERIVKFRWENLWAVWPTKLTLAPCAARKLVDGLRSINILGAPSGLTPNANWNAVRQSPGFASERWQLTQLLDWDRFNRLHHVELKPCSQILQNP
jgi:hypothetical protein